MGAPRIATPGTQKPLVGIEPWAGRPQQQHRSHGENPFSKVSLKGGGTVGDYVPVYSPSGSNSQAVYADIKANITTWVNNAYKRS